MRRVLAMGILALLAACAGRAGSDGVMPGDAGSYTIEARGGWPARQVRPTLDAAVAHCAEAGRQTAIQSTRIDQDRYTVAFRCAEPLDAPRQLLADGQRGREAAPRSQAVLVPAEAPAPTLVTSAQPMAYAVEESAVGARPSPRAGRSLRALSPDNPFAPGVAPAAAPSRQLPPLRPEVALEGRPVAPAVEARRPAGGLPPVASGFPGAPSALPAAPPSSFWLSPR